MTRCIRYFLLLSLFLFSVICFADINVTDKKNINEFIQLMVSRYHFNSAELTNLFNDIKVKPSQPIALKKNYFLNKSWNNYKMLYVTPSRIFQGVAFWNKYNDVLMQAEKKFGVPASLIVATIGIESKYG